MPGVQISRTNGEGQQISLRGMGPSFARVLLDGMPVSAASEGSVDQQARNREFDFDLLPSEIFSMLQVSKTPRASLVEGGLSGTVDLRTPRPFDYQGFKASYQLQGAYQSASEEVDPRGSFLISNNWDGKFGALLSLSMSERTFRTDGWTSQGWTSGRIARQSASCRAYSRRLRLEFAERAANAANQAPTFVNESGLSNAQLANAQVPRLGRPEVQVGNRDRIGGTLALQWAPTDNLNFNLDVIYAELEADFDRYTNNLLVRNTDAGTNNATGFGYITPSNFVIDGNNTLTSGTLLNAKFWSENRLFEQESDFTARRPRRRHGRSPTTSASTSKRPRAESDFRWRMTTYLFLSQPGRVDIDVNGGIPSDHAAARPGRMWPTGSSTRCACSRAPAKRRTRTWRSISRSATRSATSASARCCNKLLPRTPHVLLLGRRDAGRGVDARSATPAARTSTSSTSPISPKWCR